MPERITPSQAKEHLESDDKTFLVCAYDSDEKFEQNHLKGAIPLDALQARKTNLSKESEIIFYCGCPNDETAATKAAKYVEEGFPNTKILDGGVDAWKAAGYQVFS